MEKNWTKKLSLENKLIIKNKLIFKRKEVNLNLILGEEK